MKLLYYALGGGHGHALRAFGALRRAGFGEAVVPERLAPWAREAGVAFRCPPACGPSAWLASLPRPDLLLVDVFPLGPFGELAGFLGRCPAWLIARRAKAELYLEPGTRAAIESFYERILWTEDPHPDWRLLKVAQRRLEPIVFDVEPLGREAARESLGVTGTLPVVLAIGAGSRTRQAALRRVLLKICGRLRARLAFVSDELPAGDGVGPRFPAAKWLAAADAVVASGGYHAVYEARRAGAPVVFLPQPRAVDEQAWRVEGLRVARDPWELEEAVRRVLAERPPRVRGRGLAGAAQLAALLERRVQAGVLAQKQVAPPALA